MSFVGDLFGFNGGGNRGGAGMGFEATGPAQYQINDAWANSQKGLSQQEAFLHAIQAQNGLGNQSAVFQQQQDLANQLQGMANGIGPNPAQAQFQQNANQIAAQSAGLIGSQKGISPALQARLIAQQGAGAGQAAAGQAATLQAQQQMQAMNALQQQQGMMANLAGNQVGQQQNAVSGYTQGALGQQGNVLGLAGSANAANSGVAQTVSNQQGKMFGSLMNGAGAVFGMAQGGQVPGYASGVGPQSGFGRHITGYAGGGVVNHYNHAIEQQIPRGAQEDNSGGMEGMSKLAPMLMMLNGGGAVNGEQFAQQMEPVPGKAKVAGDSAKNDTVMARLSPGEIIIPRSIAQADNAPELAARFVAAVRAKNGGGLG